MVSEKEWPRSFSTSRHGCQTLLRRKHGGLGKGICQIMKKNMLIMKKNMSNYEEEYVNDEEEDVKL